MEMAQYVPLFLRAEIRYALRRLWRRWRWKLRNFVRYTLVELAVIIGFAGLFVAVWSWYFVR